MSKAKPRKIPMHPKLHKKRRQGLWYLSALILLFVAVFIYSLVPKTLASPDGIYTATYPISWHIIDGFGSPCSFKNCLNSVEIAVDKKLSNGPYATLTLIKSNLNAEDWFKQNILPINITDQAADSSIVNGYGAYHETDIDGGEAKESSYVISHNGYILYVYSEAKLSGQGPKNLSFETNIVKSIKFER